MSKRSFIFHESFYDGALALPDEDRLSLYDALAAYGTKGEKLPMTRLASVAFSFAKASIDADRQPRATYEPGRQEIPVGLRMTLPTVEEIEAYAERLKEKTGTDYVPFDANEFYDHYESNGWKTKKGTPMKKWRSAVNAWILGRAV